MIGSRPPGRLLFSAHPSRSLSQATPSSPALPPLLPPSGLPLPEAPSAPTPPASPLRCPLLPMGPLPEVPPTPPALFFRGPFPPVGAPPPSTSCAGRSQSPPHHHPPPPGRTPSPKRLPHQPFPASASLAPLPPGGAPTPRRLPHRPLPAPPLRHPFSWRGLNPAMPPAPASPDPRLSTIPSSRWGLNPAAPSAPASPGPRLAGAPSPGRAPSPKHHPHRPSSLHLSTTSSPWRGSLPKAPPTPLQSYLSDTPSSRRGTPQKILSTSCPPLRLPRCQKQTWGPPFRASWPHPGVFGFFPGFFGYFLGFSGRFLKKVGPKTSLFPPLPV